MLPSSWLLEQLAKQRMSEAEARAARRRLIPGEDLARHLSRLPRWSPRREREPGLPLGREVL